MPMVLEHIDEIARRVGRDVLMAMPPAAVYKRVMLDSLPESSEQADWETLDTRRKAIAFLEREGIGWTAYFGLEVPGLICRPYLGEIFIDIANEAADKNYWKVCAFFEYPDGSPRRTDFQLFLVPLDMASTTGARAKAARETLDE